MFSFRNRGTHESVDAARAKTQLFVCINYHLSECLHQYSYTTKYFREESAEPESQPSDRY